MLRIAAADGEVSSRENELEIVLPHGVTLEGAILGLDFESLAAVRLRAEGTAGITHTGTVDFEGHYAIPELTAGIWQVTATLDGGRRQADGRVSISDDATTARLDLEFRGLALTGQVTYQGAPLGETSIGLRGREVTTRRAVVTDYQGRFELVDLEPGAYDLSVSNSRELLNHTEELHLFTDRELRLDLGSARVRGVVRSTPGERPLPDATVIFTLLVGSEGRQGSVTALTTDDQGHFLVERLTPGRYRIEVQHDGHATLRDFLEVQSGLHLDDLHFTLEPTAGVEIHARRASGGTPESILLLAVDRAGQVGFRELRVGIPEGVVVFPTVPAGEWDLVVSSPGTAAVRIAARVPGPPVAVTLRDAGRLELTVPPLVDDALRATLTITGQDGQPFETVDSLGALHHQWDVVGGHAIVEDLPAGVWNLRVATAVGQVLQGVAVTEGQARIEVQLP